MQRRPSKKLSYSFGKSLFSYFKLFSKILMLSAQPITIGYPLPIMALLVFALAGGEMTFFLKYIVICYIFFPAVNLWNHLNDIEEDLLSGKKTILTMNVDTRKIILILVIFLYSLSIYSYLYFSYNFNGFIFFFIVLVLTWIYSDKLVFGRYFTRFKERYYTEILTYVLAYPLFILALWSMFHPVTYRALALAVLMVFLGLWGLFLKDIKDISGDNLAGLKTLAVRFTPLKIFQISLVFLILFYVSITIFAILGFFPRLSYFCTAFIILPIYVLIVLYRNNWEFKSNLVTPLNVMTFGNIIALVLLSFFGLVEF